MPSVSFGGNSSSTGYTEDYVSSSGVTVPEGRLAANGKHPVQVTSIAGYAAGRGASRSVTLSLGSASTSSFTLSAGSSASSTGSKSISYFVSDGTSATFKINANGSFYFGRGGSGSAVDSFGTSFTGKLGGSFSYDQVPTAPRNLNVVRASATSATVSWDAPTDNGGDSITGYTLQYSLNSNFSGATTVETSTTRSRTVTGLVSGEDYYFRVAARNTVTDHYNTSSVYSSSKSMASTGIGVEVWNGAAWVPSVSVEVWDGDSWNAVVSIEAWNGTAWDAVE